MLTVFFTELCFSSPISVLKYCIKRKMSETFIILKLSPRSPDESGERPSLPLTKWLPCARKHTRRKNSNTQACEIHPFHAIQEKSIASLVNSTLTFTRKMISHSSLRDIIFRFSRYHFSRYLFSRYHFFREI